jgi:hypothetical protein
MSGGSDESRSCDLEASFFAKWPLSVAAGPVHKLTAKLPDQELRNFPLTLHRSYRSWRC